MPILSVVKSLVLFVSSYRPFWVFVEVTSKYSFPDFPSTIPVPRSPFLAPRSSLPVPRFSNIPCLRLCQLFVLSKIHQEKVFDDVLVRNPAFPDDRNMDLKRPQN